MHQVITEALCSRRRNAAIFTLPIRPLRKRIILRKKWRFTTGEHQHQGPVGYLKRCFLWNGARNGDIQHPKRDFISSGTYEERGYSSSGSIITVLPDIVTFTLSSSVNGKEVSPATDGGMLINRVADFLFIWQIFPFPLLVILLTLRLDTFLRFGIYLLLWLPYDINHTVTI